jgi:guanylate kinase
MFVFDNREDTRLMELASKTRSFIFIVFGASGSGKSTLIEEIEEFEPAVSIHVKGTDRGTRQYDADEILCKSRIGPKEYDYIYSQYGHKYGVQRKQIDKALKNGKHHFIICNDISTIEAIKRDYPGKVRVVFLRFDAPREAILAIQKAKGITDDEIDLRLEKMKVLNQLFVDRPDLFNAAIINKLGASPSKMLTQLRRVIASEEAPMYVQSREMRQELRTRTLEDVVQETSRLLTEQSKAVGGVTQKGYLFILMAMLKGDPLLDDTHAAIKRAAQKLGLHAERVDDIAHAGQITDKVLGSIRCAEYVVADLTHQRANVYYELGYAHAFGKTTILAARDGTRLHFDIRNYPVIFYASGVQLETRLEKEIRRLEERRSEGQKKQEHA